MQDALGRKQNDSENGVALKEHELMPCCRAMSSGTWALQTTAELMTRVSIEAHKAMCEHIHVHVCTVGK